MSHTATQRAAVVGAGAIGLSIASALARTGRPVTVCGGRVPIDEIVLTEDSHTERWPVEHTDDPRDVAEHPTAIIAVKAHQTDGVAPWLHAFKSSGATVLVAQNGVDLRDRFAAYLDPRQIVPSVVYLNCERSAPGHVTLRRVGDRDLAVGNDLLSVELAAELNAGRMRTAIKADLTTVAWTKLLTNITANPLTALTGRRAEVMRDPGIAKLAQRIMCEAVAVGRAEGAALTMEHVDRAMHWLQTLPTEATTSMRQDRLAGRKLEYDALTGAVVRAANRHGIAVPTNIAILTLLSAASPEGGE